MRCVTNENNDDDEATILESLAFLATDDNDNDAANADHNPSPYKPSGKKQQHCYLNVIFFRFDSFLISSEEPSQATIVRTFVSITHIIITSKNQLR